MRHTAVRVARGADPAVQRNAGGHLVVRRHFGGHAGWRYVDAIPVMFRMFIECAFCIFVCIICFYRPFL